MLTLLKIKNLALVEDLSWELGPGLDCVTGETGAGKSIIVGALKLILGERADRGLIRTGEDACTVEAVFNLVKPAEVNHVLEESGLDPCEDNQLVIRRVISTSGANKQFINCSPATLTVLKSLGQYLVDLHGPHDHQSLLVQERQLDMLDAYAIAEKENESYRSHFRIWRKLVHEFDDLSSSERSNEQEIDLLRYQIDEIESADLNPAEEEEIERRYKQASNSTRLVETAGHILNALGDDDDSVLNRLSEITRLVRDLQKIDPSSSELTQGLDSAQVELQELDSNLREYLDELEINPKELAALEERINLFETLKRKYGSTLEDIIDFKNTAAKKLSRIENRGDELQRLQNEIAKARQDIDTAAKKLTAKRKKHAGKLAAEISGHLAELGFKRCQFEVALVPLDVPGSQGAERADFLFAPNPGEPSKPIRLTASSGEMSRVMLAVKSALASQDAIPLLVFDEIDANVGGEIAQAVGAKMASLGNSHQVISITHLPQVAALATSQYTVTKEFGTDDRTRSVLREVKGKQRVEEIARMLGGNAKSAKAHAESLLKG
jgi:DNA repair protein RecN (Recombination protein N)